MITMSSAYRKQLMLVLFKVGGSQLSESKMSGISFINKLKSVGLRLHPCFTPVVDLKYIIILMENIDVDTYADRTTTNNARPHLMPRIFNCDSCNLKYRTGSLREYLIHKLEENDMVHVGIALTSVSACC